MRGEHVSRDDHRVPTFTLEDLGSATRVMLFDYGEGPSIFDRITVDVDEGTPAERMTFGRIKDLYRR